MESDKGRKAPAAKQHKSNFIFNRDQGWISIYRSLKDSWFYLKPDYLRVWLHILLSANHAAKKVRFKGETIHLKAGQMVTGKIELHKQLRIPISTIEDILTRFESDIQIRQQKSNKNRIITVCGWNEYQNQSDKSDNKSDNNPTTIRQQPDTNNNEIINNDIKNQYRQFETFWEKYPRKKNKKEAEEVFMELNPSEKLFAEVMASIEKQKQTSDWMKDGGKYIQYPAKWLSSHKWSDEIETPFNPNIYHGNFFKTN